MNNNLQNSNPAYAAPVVLKTLKVLAKIINAPQNPGMSEIATDLRLPKSTTHGILAALEQSGWVLRDPVTRKYTCGHVLKDLANIASIRLPLVEIARPFLERLVQQTDEDVFLGMFTPYHILILDQVESTKALKVSTRPGTRLCVFTGAAGRVLLAHQKAQLVEELVRGTQLPAFTPKTITDPDSYLADLENVRRDGYAMDLGEYVSDVRGVAVPVFLRSRTDTRVVAGIWVLGLASTFDHERLIKAAEFALQAAEGLSKGLSGRGK
ncbi:MAG: IclR family transcriptional regulator [Pseudomonadota bacterium]